MKIGIANDHHGVEIKQKLLNYLTDKGYDVVDMGANSSDNVDYVPYAFKVGESIRDNEIDRGILICSSGIGMTIACNKIKKVRCAKIDNFSDAKTSRSHNNVNVISINSRLELVWLYKMVDIFLETEFSNEERHIRRNEMIDNYDN